MEQIPNSKKRSLLLVDQYVLPEVFGKVIQAKRLYATRQARNLSEAAEKAGISRSAFYRYKDHVFLYSPADAGRLLTLSMVLEDQKGMLRNLLECLSGLDLNIMTINQTIPADGVAGVTVTVQQPGGERSPSELMSILSGQPGVVAIRQITGG